MDKQNEHTGVLTGNSQTGLTPAGSSDPVKSPPQSITPRNQSHGHPEKRRTSKGSGSDSSSSSPEKDTGKPKKSYVNDRIPIEMWIQKYDKDGMPKATKITKQNRWDSDMIPEKDLIVYFPICLENAAFTPVNFERLLKGTVEQFKKTNLHFAIVVPDDVNRHNVAKRAPSPNTSPDTKHHVPNRLSDGDLSVAGPMSTSSSTSVSTNNSGGCSPTDEMPIDSNGSTPRYQAKCLSENRDYSEKAQELGQSWLRSVQLADEQAIAEMENRLNCKITLFFWREIMEEPNLRQLFCDRMKIITDTPPPADPKKVDLSADAIAAFVETEYSKKEATTNPSFRQIVKDRLEERFDTDRLELGGKKAGKKVRFNKYYVQEEEVGQIRFMAFAGDLPGLYIHPEPLTSAKRLSERQRISADIEWHDWWARKLLGMMTGADFLNRPNLYRFVATGYFNTALIKQNTVDSLPLKNQHRSGDNIAQGNGSDNAGGKPKRPSQVISNSNIASSSPTLEELEHAAKTKTPSPNPSPGKKRKEGVADESKQPHQPANQDLPTTDESTTMLAKTTSSPPQPDQSADARNRRLSAERQALLDAEDTQGANDLMQSPTTNHLKAKRFNLKQDTAQLIIRSRGLQEPQRAKLYQTAVVLVNEGDYLDEQGIDIVGDLLKSCTK